MIAGRCLPQRSSGIHSRKHEGRSQSAAPFVFWLVAVYFDPVNPPCVSSSAAWAAANRAVSKRNGEHDT